MGTWQAAENEIRQYLPVKEGKENFVQLEAGEFDWGQVKVAYKSNWGTVHQPNS